MGARRQNGRLSAKEADRFRFLREIGTCAISGAETEIEIAHIRGADALFGTPDSGMGYKPHWLWTVPLSASLHREQHRGSEAAFWSRYGFPYRSLTAGPMALAMVLEGFRALDNPEAARKWLRARREEAAP